MDNNKNNFILDMATQYAEENDFDPAELFKNNPVSGNTRKEAGIDSKAPVHSTLSGGVKVTAGGNQEPAAPTQSNIGPVNKPKQRWEPPKESLEGMAEMINAPVTYSKDEFRDGKHDPALKNIADDNAQQASRDAMDDMTRKQANIEQVKRELGISKLQIPPGPWHARIFAAAGDTNYRRAMDGLHEVFKDLLDESPEYVIEWADPSKNISGVPYAADKPGTNQLIDLPNGERPNAVPADDWIKNGPSNEAISGTGDPSSQETMKANSGESLNVTIDKSQLPDVSWSQEDMEKIKKAREVNLTIVEDVTLKYTELDEPDSNAVDAVLSNYIRKVNDIVGALPASRYRATFTGLSYTDILDLHHSQEMNSLDGERKKWTIAFNHIKNQSIGPWREYQYYIDPETKKKVTMTLGALRPVSLDPKVKIITVSKFDDFLMKTSFMDLEFILWKVLCATAMDKEIISIDCHGTYNSAPCKKSYDWVYAPKELLVIDSINPAVLEEMRITGEASSVEEIETCYNEAMLNKRNVVELVTSKYGVVFGHISAFDYLNEIYGKIKALESQEETPMLSQALSYSTLTVIKEFIAPKEDGSGHWRIKGVDNLIEIINNLDEIDWQTLSELVRIMLEPYQFQFSLREIKCPQCKIKSNIEIEDMTRLLFIVAQSLSSVQVVLKRT